MLVELQCMAPRCFLFKAHFSNIAKPNICLPADISVDVHMKGLTFVLFQNIH